MYDDLGNRIKGYEREVTYFSKYLIVRIDGNGFSRWTKSNDVVKPFDNRIHQLFVDTASFLLKEINAKLAYTQSDEITLVLKKESDFSEHYLGGKAQKLASILSSFTTKHFNASIKEFNLSDATFDCRVFPVPSDVEAANSVLWRTQDCARNSVLQATMAYYTHNELHGKSVANCIELLLAKGLDWNTYSGRFKWGTFIRFTYDHSGKRLLHELIPSVRPDFNFVNKMIQD